MLKKLLNHFVDRVILDKKGQAGSSGGSGGSVPGVPSFSGGISGSIGGSNTRTTRAKPLFEQQPEFKESDAARKMWWEKLQEFGSQPGYGAIAPDWGRIWEDAQKKVQRHFWGSPTDPGVVGKIKASAARRNVSESPALTNMMARMGAEEGNVLSTMATDQATKEAQFAESGRLNYLKNLQGLTNLRTQGNWWTPWTNQKSFKWDVGAKAGFGM